MIGFSIFLHVLLGAAYLVFPPIRRSDRVFGASLLVVAYLQQYFLWVQNGRIVSFPNLFMSYIPLMFALGPLLLLFFLFVSEPEFKLKRRHAIHGVPVMIAVVWFMIQVMKPDDETVYIIEHLFQNFYIYSYAPISVMAGLSVLAYSFYILKFQPQFKRSSLLLALTFILFSTLMMLVAFNTYLSLPLAHFGNSTVAVCSIALFILHYRQPRLFEQWVYDIQKERYKKSQLSGLNKIDIQQTLLRLVDKEKVYTDSGLTLQSLALKAMLSPHQLSEYINGTTGLSVSQYINLQRVNLAKILLVENRDKTTLSIGLDSGFNSDASFNRNFKQFTGMSPGQYRKKHG